MLRRDFKLYIRSLAGALVLCMILSFICGLAAFCMMKSADNSAKTAKVALAVSDNSLVGKLLINTIEQAYLSTLLDITEANEDEALEGVKNGEYVAAIILPEGFISDVSSGVECRAKVLLSNKARTEADTISSIVSFGERLMLAGQYGVFAGERLIAENQLSYTVRSEFLEGANSDLMNEALGFNSKYFTFETLDYHGTGMPTESYYALCWSLLFLFLISLFFIPMFLTDCSQGMLNRLFAYGMGKVKFMQYKLIIMAFSRVLLFSAITAVLHRLGIVYIDLIAVIFTLVGIAYITVVGAALTMCFGDGITGNVLSVIMGMFLCGGIIPLPMLPGTVTTIGRFTPFGTAKAFFEPLFGAQPDTAAMAVAVLYTALAIWLVGNKLSKTVVGRA